MFAGTELENINFEFYENMTFAFDSTYTQEQYYQFYTLLLEKFEKEGKSNSYKNVDILFKKYRYDQIAFVGTTVSIIDNIWWNYGYDKKRIIYITIAALIIFYLINLIFQKQLLEIYPIFTNKERQTQIGYRKTANQYILLFLLTLYIFFSLKVDFDKVQTHRNRILLYFFLQYFFGLICLLFLFGAIMKF